MRNTGTWDSDLLFIFAACFFSPVVLFFLLGIFLRIKEFLETPYSPPVVYVPVEKEVIKVNNVYHYCDTPKPKSQRKKRPVQPKKTYKKPKKPNNTNTTGQGISSEAVSCLVSLGWAATSAKRVVSNACAVKRYKTAEDIVIDLIKSSP